MHRNLSTRISHVLLCPNTTFVAWALRPVNIGRHLPGSSLLCLAWSESKSRPGRSGASASDRRSLHLKGRHAHPLLTAGGSSVDDASILLSLRPAFLGRISLALSSHFLFASPSLPYHVILFLEIAVHVEHFPSTAAAARQADYGSTKTILYIRPVCEYTGSALFALFVSETGSNGGPFEGSLSVQ